MKRYWIEVKINISEYDEQQKSVKPKPALTETFTNLTPEPGSFITETLKDNGSRIGKMLEGEQ